MDVGAFGNAARSLARNPLGIIALFIVLVYGLAGLVIIFASALTLGERVPLIVFLVTFPVLVLAVFFFLVTRHVANLYSPADYRNEENFVRMQMKAAASIAAASDKVKESVDVDEIVSAVRRYSPSRASDPATGAAPFPGKRVLWIDDRPNNNLYERRAFEAVGVDIDLALNTDEAVRLIDANRFDAIISDMGRVEGPREGYVLLDTLRERGVGTPYFIYAGSRSPESQRETHQHGGDGTTNRPDELFTMVTSALGA